MQTLSTLTYNDTGATKVADTYSLSLTRRHSTYRGKLRKHVCFHEIEKTSTVKALSAEFSFSCSGEVVLLYGKYPTCPHTWHLKKEALLCLLSCGWKTLPSQHSRRSKRVKEAPTFCSCWLIYVIFFCLANWCCMNSWQQTQKTSSLSNSDKKAGWSMRWFFNINLNSELCWLSRTKKVLPGSKLCCSISEVHSTVKITWTSRDSYLTLNNDSCYQLT